MIYYDKDNNPYIKYQSESIKQITSKLATAKESFATLEKTGDAQYGKFASLSDISNACSDSLGKNGLSVLGRLATINNRTIFVLTLYDNDSEEFLTSSAELGDFKTIHSFGSYITYFRRYLLNPLLNLEGEPDDDGEIAQNEQEPKPNYNVKGQPYRYMARNGSVREYFRGDNALGSYAKKICSLIYVYQTENKPVLLHTIRANIQEITRVKKELQCIPEMDDVESNAHKTLLQAENIINEDDEEKANA